MRREDKRLFIENIEIFNFYVDRLVTLTLSQLEYHGEPDTCDMIYFERKTLYNTTACFFRPKGVKDIYSTGYEQKGSFTGYGYPDSITPIDFNGRQYETDDFEILYDNVTKRSILPFIYLYAKKLYEVDQTIRINLMHQNKPYIVPSTSKNESSIKAFFQNLFAFAPVLPVRKTDYNPLTDIKAVDLRVDFKGNDLYELKRSIWAEALHVLGIAPSNTKKERLITGEIVLDRQEDIVSIQSRLLQRVRFLDRVNKRWGLNITVNPTVISDNVKEFIDPFGYTGQKDIFGNKDTSESEE